MMGHLSKELNNIQNPTLGAFVIWNFVRGYHSNNSEFTPFPLLFIVMPIICREDIIQILNSTNKPSGLRTFADKFLSTKVLKNDVLSQIHNDSANMKELSLDSIRIAIYSSLISLDYENAMVYPITKTEHKSEPKSIIKFGKAAEKLGYWCSQLTIHEISHILKVRF